MRHLPHARSRPALGPAHRAVAASAGLEVRSLQDTALRHESAIAGLQRSVGALVDAMRQMQDGERARRVRGAGSGGGCCGCGWLWQVGAWSK
jgi:hypothetical protein